MPLYQVQRDESAFWRAADVEAFTEPGTVEEAAQNVWASERRDPTEWGQRWRVAVWADENLNIPRDLVIYKSGPNLSGVPDPDAVREGDTIAYHLPGDVKVITQDAAWDEFAVGDQLVGGNGPELYVVVEPYPAFVDREGCVYVRRASMPELTHSQIAEIYPTNKLGDHGYGFFAFNAPQRPYHKVMVVL